MCAYLNGSVDVWLCTVAIYNVVPSVECLRENSLIYGCIIFDTRTPGSAVDTCGFTY